jgi:hypothetical protein
MNFRDLEKFENKASSTKSTESSSFQLGMLSEYLEKEKRKSGAKENPFVYFYEDVISSPMNFDFHAVLGDGNYRKASDDASTCLNSCNEFRKLSPLAIDGWLQNALKFVDHIVLHYIQDCCKVIPKTYPSIGIEKARYIQLSENEDKLISVVGAELKDLYDLRNKFEHRTIVHEDGKQELIAPKRGKALQVIQRLYPDALKGILATYNLRYPS